MIVLLNNYYFEMAKLLFPIIKEVIYSELKKMNFYC
jgi:hypothetical protein